MLPLGNKVQASLKDINQLSDDVVSMALPWHPTPLEKMSALSLIRICPLTPT